MTRMMMLLLLAGACTPEVPLGLSVRPPPGDEYAGLRVLFSSSSFSSAKVTVSLDEVEIEQRSAGERRWLPLLDVAHSYDLASLSVPTELVAAGLPEGSYGRIRIRFSDAYLTVPGKVVPIELLESRTEVVLKDRVPIEASRQTTLVLDFDADGSISRDAQGRVIMQPVISVKAMSIR